MGFFLFIFESIGTSELILIGIVALIFLGPRKLPQIARTIGKTLAEFRSATNEFKSTWEREANFEDEEQAKREAPPDTLPVNQNFLAEAETETIEPAVKEIDKSAFDTAAAENNEAAAEQQPTEVVLDKRNWL